ncbi:AMP-binding protein [Actinomadura luteofluorescens]|uniref:AMP-binding protein n=1 Tax=Actinomadura luteofluorescens TaxID=46163 RepID=UPI00363D94E1
MQDEKRTVPGRTAVLGDDRPARETAFAELVAARGGDDRTGLCFEDRSWTWREVVAESLRRASLVRDLPGHVGLFLENGPEHLFWLLGAALAGVPVVELNPTRRGAELARDITHTDCALLVTEASRAPLLDGLTRVPSLAVDTAAYAERLASARLAAPAPVDPDTVFSLVFTSGTTSAPKAVICTQRRLGRIAVQQRDRRRLTCDDVFYVVMPMFHSNALMAGIAPAVAAAAASCCAAGSRPRGSCRMCAATASRSSTTSASPSATSWPSRRSRTTPTTRSASRSATRRRSATSTRSPAASAAP